jgi:adenine deaminase
MKHFALLAITLILHLGYSFAQEITAIRADRLVTGLGTEVANPLVIISGERITAILTGKDTRIPSGARLIDLSGHTILPGFIHTLHPSITMVAISRPSKKPLPMAPFMVR